MRVHHINCATLCPYGGRFGSGSGPLWTPGRLVCHCLLVETNDGLVLIDTGFGLGDIRSALWRFGPVALALLKPRLNEAETAVRQVVRLGWKPEDVRHIIPTHLDYDHAGALPDFPRAKVHILAEEHRGAMERRTLLEKGRYVKAQWAHGPDWVTYRADDGEDWFGFIAVRALHGLPPDILLVPLTGHTRGHAAVAVMRDDGRWLLHAGDAYMHRDEMNAAGRRCPPILDLFQRVESFDRRLWAHNQDRLSNLARNHARDVSIFCAHDAVEFDRFLPPLDTPSRTSQTGPILGGG